MLDYDNSLTFWTEILPLNGAVVRWPTTKSVSPRHSSSLPQPQHSRS